MNRLILVVVFALAFSIVQTRAEDEPNIYFGFDIGETSEDEDEDHHTEETFDSDVEHISLGLRFNELLGIEFSRLQFETEDNCSTKLNAVSAILTIPTNTNLTPFSRIGIKRGGKTACSQAFDNGLIGGMGVYVHPRENFSLRAEIIIIDSYTVGLWFGPTIRF